MFDDSARPSYAPILYRQVYHPSPLRFTEIRTRGKHAAPFLGYAPVALLLSRLLLAFGQREALGLFAACCAFPNVISALAISHKALTLTLLRLLPSTFALPGQEISFPPFRKQRSATRNSSYFGDATKVFFVLSSTATTSDFARASLGWAVLES